MDQGPVQVDVNMAIRLLNSINDGRFISQLSEYQFLLGLFSMKLVNPSKSSFGETYSQHSQDEVIKSHNFTVSEKVGPAGIHALMDGEAHSTQSSQFF